MADAKKRIILYQEKTTVDNSDYVLTDSSANGTKKYQVTRILTEAEATAQAKVDAEAAAREAADNELKDDLNLNVSDDIMSLTSWGYGTISVDGEPWGEQYRDRLRSESIDITPYTTATFSVASGYKYRALVYDANGNFVKELFNLWRTEDNTYDFSGEEKYLRLVLSNASNGTILLDAIRQMTVFGDCKNNQKVTATESRLNTACGLGDDVNIKSWTTGYIYATGSIGPGTDFPQYVCTQAIQQYPFSIVLSADDGYQYIVRLYSADRASVAYSTEWVTTEFYIPENTPFTINASKVVLETVTDVNAYATAIHAKSYAVYTLTSPAKHKNIKIAVLGDSISTFTGYSEDTGTAYYPTGNVQNVNQMWWKIVADTLGVTEIAVSAISRTAFYDFGTDLPPVYTDDRITQLGVNGSPDVVFVNAGTNDGFAAQNTNIAYTEDITALNALANSTVKGIALTIRKIQAAYPSAKIVMLIPKQVKLSDMVDGYDLERVSKIADEIKAYSEIFGVWKVIDLRQCGLNQSNIAQYCIDGNTHPNAAGMRSMALYILEQLR